MGLFGGKQENCPVCGNQVKGLFKLKIKDGALCQQCAQKINMDNSMIPYQSIDDMKAHLAYREQNQIAFDNFVVSREIYAGGHYFRVDETKKLWYSSNQKQPINPPIFRFDEIVDYEFSEDGETVTKGGLGRAAVGGLLFGGVGAVVGGVTGGKKSKTIVKSMKIRISLKNKYTTSCEIELVSPGTDCKAGGFIYNTNKQVANNLISLLDSMTSQAQAAPSEQASAAPQASAADEIMKFKNLLDNGVITQEEFDAKKKQLLGL